MARCLYYKRQTPNRLMKELKTYFTFLNRNEKCETSDEIYIQLMAIKTISVIPVISIDILKVN